MIPEALAWILCYRRMDNRLDSLPSVEKVNWILFAYNSGAFLIITFLNSYSDFTHAIANIVTMSPVERDAIRASARCAVARFSEAEFDEHWYKAMSFLVGDGEQK